MNILGKTSLRGTAARLQQLRGQLTHPTSFAAAPTSAVAPLLASRSSGQIRAMASSIPSTMKGVIVEKTGGVEVLDYKTDLPVPQPKDNEILIKNDIVGVNYIDTYFRSGLYQSPKPEVLGREAEGHVVSIPPSAADKTSLKVGDRVVWVANHSYAEYSAVPTDNVWAVGASVPRGIAAASILQGLTGITLIDEAHHVKPGDWVLVHAAAGGMGQWLVQLLHQRGAHVIATASTDDKRALAKSLGADVVTGYDRDDVLAAVKQHTPNGEGAAAVFDGVGKDTFDLSLEVVARKGTLVSFGNASGAPAPLTLARLSAKNIKVCRPSLFNYLTTAEERARYGKELFDFLAAGNVKVSTHKTYDLSDIRQAHTDLEGRKTTGKLLLDPTK